MISPGHRGVLFFIAPPRGGGAALPCNKVQELLLWNHFEALEYYINTLLDLDGDLLDLSKISYLIMKGGYDDQ